MSTVGEYPIVCSALNEMFSVFDMTFICEAAALEVPEVWEQNFLEAEELARKLRGKTIGEFLKPTEYVDQGYDDDEDVLSALITGKTDMVAALVRAAKCDTLNEVLEAGYDGQLQQYWKRRHC